MAPRSTPKMRRLPLRRRIEPLRQGDLDGLCGVYEIVNAVRHPCPAVNEAQAKVLFAALIDVRAKRPMRRPLTFIYRGLTRAGLSRSDRLGCHFARHLSRGRVVGAA